VQSSSATLEHARAGLPGPRRPTRRVTSSASTSPSCGTSPTVPCKAGQDATRSASVCLTCPTATGIAFWPAWRPARSRVRSQRFSLFTSGSSKRRTSSGGRCTAPTPGMASAGSWVQTPG